ncbi:phosphoribosylpyrophosphate synthetase [Dyella jiangningensis]|nr:phosphoribosylpyrophosphate synthetase [Dyella jiangningensis]
MKTLVYAMPGNDDFADLVALRGRWERRGLSEHRFPDEEVLVTVTPPDADAHVLLVCTLDHPDPKVVPLLMAASTLRDLGATRITLVAPYLAYLRQDRRFHPGEAISSEIFGQLLGRYVDGVITVDPHLHRHASLKEAGLGDGVVASAAPALAHWIRSHVLRPLIVGPDEESLQWATQVGEGVQAPVMTGRKTRHDDARVSIALPRPEPSWMLRTPVIVDDIASSGRTLSECATQLVGMGLSPPICIAVHGIGAAVARQRTLDAGAMRFLTTNSVGNRCAEIDISGCIVNAIVAMDASTTSISHRSS